jgi:polyisoprenoid-binding protein YceI
MKQLALAFLLLLTGTSGAQIYTAKAGSTAISFYSEAPLENIEALNKSATIVMKASTGDLQIRLSMQNFKFKNALMEEHFNENYMESDKFPNAEFKGRINETVDYSKGEEQKLTVTGKMTIHGETRDITIPGTLTKSGDELHLVSKFPIRVADYKIKVPSMYVKNIAEVVDVTFNTTLEPFNKK